MSIISFNITKIAAERKSGPAPKLDVNANTGITDITETKIGSQKALQFQFSHVVRYGGGFASVAIEGTLLVLSNEQEAKDTLASYKKNKTFSQDLTRKVYNAVLTRANTEALLLAKELGLPPPFRLPQMAAKPAADAKAPAKEGKKK